jgi:hypothetical protein
VSLTVAIPTIGRPTLLYAIQSVLAQTVPTDLVVVHDHKPLTDGPGPKLNQAVAASRTEWMAFLGDDDRLDVHYHEWLLEMTAQRDVDVVVFTARYSDSGTLPTTTELSQLDANGGAGYALAWRTDLARDHPFIAETPGVHWDKAALDTWRAANAKVAMSSRIAYYIRH